MTVQVAVEAAVYAIDKPYTYLLPDSLHALPGSRVSVPFGRGNRISEAIVLSVGNEDAAELKAVAEVLDEEPLLDEGMLRLAAFLRERCFCTFYDAIKAILPAAVWLQTETVYEIADEGWQSILPLTDPLRPMMEHLAALGGKGTQSALTRQLGADCGDGLKTLEKRGLLREERELQRRNTDKTEAILSLRMQPEEAVALAAAQKRRAPMQAAVLELLASTGTASKKEVCYFTGASSETVRRLAELGYLEVTEREILRTSVRLPDAPAKPLILNPEQQYVFDRLSEQSRQENPGVALLYGVTGSGKTAVYLSLIRRTLDSGKSAILLVPEIALTPQLVELLASHFGKEVAVLHSRLRLGERCDEWKRIRRGDARVVVGTRSAVFAPVRELGLLIVDEEHEHSYKSENTPRYHAREVAFYRGYHEHALVLLGSATPSVESMYRARSGAYTLHILRERFNGKPLPTAEIVDMKQELRSGNGTPVSTPLRNALLANAGRQAILFLNRRGASKMTVCVGCGFVPQCPNCSVNLTYHKANGRLMCHYCGHSQPASDICPVCGGHLKQVGFGTQRVQEELEKLLPGQEILRMDADTVTATNTHESILNRFREDELPVLIGTQMVTKGLNFPKVTLVGVLDADAALYMDNFRAAETAFSIVTQVIGRSGRGSETGKAFLQTMTPENPVIGLAARQDYDGFYELELPMRQLRGCPPFADLITVTFSGIGEAQTAERARHFRTMLQTALPGTRLAVRILGPAPAAVARVCGRYRYRLTLSLQSTREARLLIAALLRAFSKEKESKGVSAFVDINPYE